jgi:hypothetical protein
MPSTSRALTRAARARAAATGEPYTQAREQLVWIQELLDDGACETREDAEAYVADPANQTMCTVCGWTWGMVCPECAKGCGCSTGCSGWRHEEFMDEDERRDRNECPECGGDSTTHYECTCYDDEP